MSLLPTLLFASSIVFASDPKPADSGPPPIKMSGLLFGYWGLVLGEDGGNYNEFGLDRVYVRAAGDINDRLAARVTLDANHLKATALPDGSEVTVDTRLRVFVKHAFLEWKDAAPGVKMRFGMVETAIGPYSDEYWGHRFLSESFSNLALGLSTADLGISAQGNHGDGLVEWQLNAVNGEGYSKVEVDSGKMGQGRVTVNPLAGSDNVKLPITGFVAYHTSPVEDGDTLYALGSAAIEHDYVQVWGQYGLRRQGDVTGMGYSIFLMPRVPDVGNLILRYDSFDPDTEVEDDASTLLIAGASHFFAKKVAGAVTFERTATESAPDAPSQAVYVRMLAGF